MDFGSTAPSDGFECDSRTEDSFNGASGSTIVKLTQKKGVLRDEVSALRKQSKDVTEFLRRQTTCSSRNVEIEDKIDFVCGDTELLEARHSELEVEIAALQMRIESAKCNRTLKDETGSYMKQQTERVISCYGKILQFRLDNEIFDGDLPSLQTLKKKLSECAEFMKQIKALRIQLGKLSTEDLNSTAERNSYREALRSYIELLLRYYEVQLSRMKLVASRLRKATK